MRGVNVICVSHSDSRHCGPEVVCVCCAGRHTEQIGVHLCRFSGCSSCFHACDGECSDFDATGSSSTYDTSSSR
jgi:hypothetical protein